MVAKGHVDVAIDAIDEVMRYGNDVEGHTAFGSAMRRCSRPSTRWCETTSLSILITL